MKSLIAKARHLICWCALHAISLNEIRVNRWILLYDFVCNFRSRILSWQRKIDDWIRLWLTRKFIQNDGRKRDEHIFTEQQLSQQCCSRMFSASWHFAFTCTRQVNSYNVACIGRYILHAESLYIVRSMCGTLCCYLCIYSWVENIGYNFHIVCVSI